MVLVGKNVKILLRALQGFSELVHTFLVQNIHGF